MRIKARLRTTCPLCSRPIFPGSVVAWTPGKVARHIDCAVDPETGRRARRFRSRRADLGSGAANDPGLDSSGPPSSPGGLDSWISGRAFAWGMRIPGGVRSASALAR